MRTDPVLASRPAAETRPTGTPAAASAPDATWRTRLSPARLLPGLLLCALIAVAATFAGRAVPTVGPAVIAIVTGVLVRVLLPRAAALLPGVDVAKSSVLQMAVIVLGAQLSVREVIDVGVGSLPTMLGTLAACLGVAYVVGRRLRIDGTLRTLIGVGTAICGASAIAAVSPVIRARSEQIAYAVSTIFVFNVTAVLVFPPLGHALGLSQHTFGLFAGTAVNDTSSVVATASAYGHAATGYAVVVKLVRTLMIIPICVALAAIAHRRDVRSGRSQEATAVRPLALVPWFLVGFVAVATANSLGVIPAAAHAPLAQAATFMITIALAGIGLSTDLAGLRRTGPRPLVLGLTLWVTVALTSLVLQWATG